MCHLLPYTCVWCSLLAMSKFFPQTLRKNPGGPLCSIPAGLTLRNSQLCPDSYVPNSQQVCGNDGQVGSPDVNFFFLSIGIYRKGKWRQQGVDLDLVFFSEGIRTEQIWAKKYQRAQTSTRKSIVGRHEFSRHSSQETTVSYIRNQKQPSFTETREGKEGPSPTHRPSLRQLLRVPRKRYALLMNLASFWVLGS